MAYIKNAGIGKTEDAGISGCNKITPAVKSGGIVYPEHGKIKP